MKKVAIFGGSFDPVHNGHISLAKDAADEVGLDELIFMPAYIQPFKQGHDTTECNHRFAMLRAVTEEDTRFAVSNYELRTRGISYTYKMLRAVKAAYDVDDRLYFMCGTDSFLNIEIWKEAEELLENYYYIIGVRPGYKEVELDETIKRIHAEHGTSIVKIHNRRIDVSSTEVRKKLANDENVNGMIPSYIKWYIKANGLYK